MTTYTKVPNTILEKLWSIDVSATEYKVLCFIIRFTLGFNRNSAPISSSFVSQRLNINKTYIQKAIKSLIDKGILWEYKEPTHTTPREVGLNESLFCDTVVKNDDRGIDKIEDRGIDKFDDRGVVNFDPQENKYINKTINKTNKEYPEKNWSGYEKENNCTFDPIEFFNAAVEKSMRMTGG